MTGRKYSAAICTLGCRVNQYESDCIISEFVNNEFTIKDFSDADCDVYVINTCTVTAASDKKSKQMIRRAKKLNPTAIIAVCGCFSQANPDVFKSDLHADVVLGTPEKTKIVSLVLELLDGANSANVPNLSHVSNILVKNIDEYKTYENIKAGFSGKTRAYIKIQDGCEAACSYCIVPRVRGPEKSRRYNDIYEEAKRFETAGYHELVFAGIEVSSYGRDLKYEENIGLIDLLEKLNNEPDLTGIKSLRLSSIDPFLLRKDFVDRLAALDKIANHLHLSLQSGSTRILNLMRRRYSAERVVENIAYAKTKINGLNLTADIIVGFPTETDEDFEKTLAIVKDLRIYHAHIFTYSKRAGTDAAEFSGQVAENIKNTRSQILSQTCEQIKKAIHAENIGREFDVIIEDFSDKNGVYTAKTRNFMDVRIVAGRCNTLLRGSVQRVKITDYGKDFLYGEIV